MVKFLCFDIKKHSYFVLVTYISFLFFSLLVLFEIVMVDISRARFPFLTMLSTTYLIFFLLMDLLTVAAFVIYLFKDDYRTRFHVFYANTLTISFAVTFLMIIIFFVNRVVDLRKKNRPYFLFTLFCFAALLATAGCFHLAYRNRQIVTDDKAIDAEEKKSALDRNYVDTPIVGNHA